MDARPAPVQGAGPEPFAGRSAELAALTAQLRAPATGRGCRVLLVVGRPGAGRTALARRFARTELGGRQLLTAHLADPDGTPHAPGAVARRLLALLGRSTRALPPAGPGAADPACAELRAALTGRDTLLLLDDVPDAEHLAPLLPEEPRCLVLAVSAGPLTALADRFPVDPVILRGLDEAAAVELLTALVGGTRIGCDPVAAAELGEACAERPAPLRLMAGWLRAHPKAAVPEAAVALRAVEGAADPLAAALLLRYRALPVAQARMLRMLTLAPGGRVDPRTASALAGCPAPEAVAVLHALAEQELLDQADPAADGTARYRLPGRHFARLLALREEHDRPAAVQLARARLLERLIRLTDSARALLDPAVPAPDPLPGPLRLRSAEHARRWLAEECEWLLAAAEQALARADLDGSVGRLVGALLRTLPLAAEHGLPAGEAHRLHALVLALAERQGAPRRAAAALLNLGDLRAAAGEWAVAAEHYQAAVAHTRQPRDDAAAARALEGVGECRRALGEAVRAADAYGRALALRQGLGDGAGQARLLTRLAEAHAAQRRFDEAVREYRSALGLLRRLGDERGAGAVGRALNRLSAS
ncbi:tetratricopeptide repeat protein [Kitasatospora viridis]|uniref:Tetratricopeptide repeat protein n=1 Tax=Kitasatospora viridis TaxID=281105 RepID=A0A561UCW5_9ACTN|nr:tetratricopeptide repeat protein [Kitasatospora viridis]TWF97188.1 tetratricopeptide repeat protein [Kitasatospora viridis]